ncbi:ATP-binding protein [Desulfoplanes sp. PS50]
MSVEGQTFDIKSIRSVTGKTADFSELSKDGVAFANAQGGRLLIGIEDGEEHPPDNQIIPKGLVEKIERRIGELTSNVYPAVQKKISETNQGEYLEVTIPRSHNPASTADGRFYLRIGDESRPLVGEEITRLINERNAQPWETMTTLGIGRSSHDPFKLSKLTEGLRKSDRVKDFVKEKTDQELVDHYHLAIGDLLTNLGILCIGHSHDRVRLGTAPIIQLIKYDADNNKVNKISWDDHCLTPMELLDAVWDDTPDFREFYELPEGMFRQQIPVYDKRVVRELLVNALVHRPYSQRGDIYINLHPDSLEIINPGLLPLGVTPHNILHQSVRRNNSLARLFHDLKLMEREGSGYDLIYEVLTSQGRGLPVVTEGDDSVKVVIPRRIIKTELIDFLGKIDRAFHLSQKERIALGILVQTEGMTSIQLADTLDLSDTSAITPWIQGLLRYDIIQQTGRTKGTRYFVNPKMLRKAHFPTTTTLSRIQPHRLQALIVEDLQRYPNSAFGEIRDRLGHEITEHRLRGALKKLLESKKIQYNGEKRWRRYRLS